MLAALQEVWRPERKKNSHNQNILNTIFIFCIFSIFYMYFQHTFGHNFVSWCFSLRIFFFLILFIYLFIYLWLCWVFVSVRGLSLVVASGGHSSSRCEVLSLSRASLVAEHRLQTRRLSSCGSWAQLLCGMWDLPRPGLEPVSPALAGRFLTTAPPGKPSLRILIILNRFPCCCIIIIVGFNAYVQFH